MGEFFCLGWGGHDLQVQFKGNRKGQKVYKSQYVHLWEIWNRYLVIFSTLFVKFGSQFDNW